MSLIRFEIRFADGRTEVATVEGERALIGHAAHCDVRLPIDQAASEHVAVHVIGGTVRIESKAIEPAATVNGMPFATIPISPESPLTVGTTRIFISLVETTGKRGGGGGPAPKRESQAATSPLVQALGIGILIVGGYYVLPDPPRRSAPPPAELPDIFASAAPACDLPPDQALSRAESRRDMANADRERSPFVPRDGLAAVELYETAAACYQKAGATAKMTETANAAKALRETITLDLRARRVRLEHLLAVGDYELAARDVHVLETLTAGKRGPWIDWLAGVDQLVKQKVAPAK